MKKKISLLAFCSAVAFAAAWLFLPPQGKIDSTVLMLVAQLLVLCATLLGVDSYFDKLKQLMSK